jgi:ubiquinone/menaquinone biosynthesis C-methylase UbiE
MTRTVSHERDYIPGLGRGVLTPLYDAVHRVFGVGRLHRLMVGLADLEPGMRVADLGCGTGNLLVSLAAQRSDLDLVGLDPDPKALTLAARKTRRRGLAVSWERGFGQELSFPGASVDRAFSSLMLHHLDDTSQEELLGEVRRVLRPGGVLVLADMTRHGPGAMTRHGRGHALRRGVLRHLGRRPVSEVPDSALVAQLQDAGFRVEAPTVYPLSGLPITVVRAVR